MGEYKKKETDSQIQRPNQQLLVGREVGGGAKQGEEIKKYTLYHIRYIN